MYRLIFKKFTNKEKLEEAKKRAMSTYEAMMSQQKILMNNSLEEQLMKNKDINTDYKSKEVHDKISNFISNYEFVETKRPSLKQFNNIHYNLKNETLYCNMSEFLKRSFNDEKEWLTIYECIIDKSYEKFKKIVKFIIFSIVIYKTIKYINKKKELSRLNYMSMIVFYSFFITIFFMDRGFSKRLIHRIQLNKDNFDRVKITLQNKKNPVETELINIFSISSKKKNFHEIVFYNVNNKITQLFASKNAKYDPELLINICHKNVRKVKFYNLY